MDRKLLAYIEQVANEQARRSPVLADLVRGYTIEALGRIKTIRAPEAIRAIIKKIAARIAGRLRRRLSRETDSLSEPAIDPRNGVEDDLRILEEERQRLLNAINKLDFKDQEILELVGKGVPLRKAAELLGIPTRTYRRRRDAILLTVRCTLD